MDASSSAQRSQHACRTVLQRDAVGWMEQLGPEGFPEKACALAPLAALAAGGWPWHPWQHSILDIYIYIYRHIDHQSKISGKLI